MNGTLVLLVLPLLVLDLILKGISIADWWKRDEYQGLGRTGWLVCILLITLFGSLSYLVYGRKEYVTD